MSTADGGEERPVTTDGSEKDRIKYGTASWVYGEELNQTTAMWWSPDSSKLAYYRFDEKEVQDYYLQLDQTQVQSTMDVEAYPKAGTANPIVDLFVYDVASGKTTKVDVRSGQPFDNDAVGHYVYRIAWSPDGSELLFNRTNRRQQILEFVAANPSTGETRVILREEWPTGWVRNSPPIHWLADGTRFIWESERTGWANLYLYDISGKLITPLTTHDTFETAGLTKVDEQAGVIFYQARSGDNHMKVQLHRVGFDGTGDVRLTDPAFHHTVGGCLAGAGGGGRGGGAAGGANTCGISPDNKYFVDVYQAHNRPPATRLVDAAEGTVVAEVTASDLSRYKELGFRPAEMFTYKAADGETTLYGRIIFPSNFDPSKKYPALASVYGGPGSTATNEVFATPNSLAEYGFLILTLDSRSSPGRGKRTLDAAYLKLGVTEMEDMALGVKALWDRSYFDRQRVGIYGTSYGGYAAVLSLLRYPGHLPGRVRFVAGQLLVSLRHDLHRAVHVDPAGEQGRVRGRQRDELREGPSGPADAILRDGGQQRPPVEHDAAHQSAAGRRQELRGPDRARPRAHGHQSGPDDGVLHREPGPQARGDDGADILKP
jgi:dipeptidyl-peptidase 4